MARKRQGDFLLPRAVGWSNTSDTTSISARQPQSSPFHDWKQQSNYVFEADIAVPCVVGGGQCLRCVHSGEGKGPRGETRELNQQRDDQLHPKWPPRNLTQRRIVTARR